MNNVIVLKYRFTTGRGLDSQSSW